MCVCVVCVCVCVCVESVYRVNSCITHPLVRPSESEVKCAGGPSRIGRLVATVNRVLNMAFTDT